MKKFLFVSLTLLVTTQSQALIYAQDMGYFIDSCRWNSGGKNRHEHAEKVQDCQITTLIISLPTVLMGDSEINKSSPEYFALAVDQAARTVNGEITLLFGNDTAKAQSFIDAVHSANQ